MLDSQGRRHGYRVSSISPIPVRLTLDSEVTGILIHNSSRRWAPCHAICALENGHLPRYLRYHLGRYHSRLWTLSSDSMRTIRRPWPCLLRHALAAYLSQPLHYIRRSHRHQMFWCRSQLPDHHRGLDAGRRRWLCARY